MKMHVRPALDRRVTVGRAGFVVRSTGEGLDVRHVALAQTLQFADLVKPHAAAKLHDLATALPDDLRVAEKIPGKDFDCAAFAASLQALPHHDLIEFGAGYAGAPHGG